MSKGTEVRSRVSDRSVTILGQPGGLTDGTVALQVSNPYLGTSITVTVDGDAFLDAIEEELDVEIIGPAEFPEVALKPNGRLRVGTLEETFLLTAEEYRDRAARDLALARYLERDPIDPEQVSRLVAALANQLTESDYESVETIARRLIRAGVRVEEVAECP